MKQHRLMMVIKILGLDKQGRKGAESLINASKAQSKLPREQAFTYIWPAALKKKNTISPNCEPRHVSASK